MSIIIPPSVPNYGFNHQEMSDIVSSELSNVSIGAQITGWLNLATTDLASKYIFGTLHKYGSKTTVAGIPDIILEDDFYWLKTIGVPSQQRKLYPENENLISEVYPQYRNMQGTTSWYYLNGKICGLWYVPSSAFAIEYSYQRRPTKLINPLDVCDLPYEWHPLVIQKAVSKGYSQEGNDNGFAISMQLEARLLRELQVSAYRRPDETIVLGSPRFRGHIPRPKLPGNFPTQ